jgi:hypothetical protein
LSNEEEQQTANSTYQLAGFSIADYQYDSPNFSEQAPSFG